MICATRIFRCKSLFCTQENRHIKDPKRIKNILFITGRMKFKDKVFVVKGNTAGRDKKWVSSFES
jgi:hypothetical protein